jgi:hypothetical protein
VKLTVTSRLNAPTTFDQDQGQTTLVIGENEYSQDFDAENLPGESFVWNDEDIQPGEERVGTVIFDVPDSAVGGLDTDGNLYVTNFSESGVDASEIKTTVAVLRTYQ